MDLNEYSIFGTINLEKTPAINYKRTLAFLNHFVTHTVRFLNRFSGDCENKLRDLQGKIQKLETTLCILEAKLSSIPGLDDVTGPINIQPTNKEPSTTVSSQETELPVQNADIQKSEIVPVTVEVSDLTVSKDPRYMKFFKMLNVGVPLPAVKAKVAQEGLNPDLLDTPNAPAPPTATQLDIKSDNDDSDDSMSSFSDD
ncbi:WASH complex subunit 3 isoform X3 [Hydra vulgaris]|uniref:WASH complex subunit 3 isoform X3 n=1 Tax=Hydra vulgaris TaxID=6087 RepID=A0ABM4D7V5_HYDVU